MYFYVLIKKLWCYNSVVVIKKYNLAFSVFNRHISCCRTPFV